MILESASLVDFVLQASKCISQVVGSQLGSQNPCLRPPEVTRTLKIHTHWPLAYCTPRTVTLVSAFVSLYDPLAEALRAKLEEGSFRR